MPIYFDFEISREFACSTASLFDAWASPAARAKWFVGPPQWVETGRSLDFREGGSETLTGNFDGTMTTEYNAHIYDIVPGQRIGYGFEVRLGGEIYSISTAVVEFIETAKGAEMKFHEQLAVFSGQTVEEAKPNRIMGTDAGFDRLQALVEGGEAESDACGAAGLLKHQAEQHAN